MRLEGETHSGNRREGYSVWGVEKNRRAHCDELGEACELARLWEAEGLTVRMWELTDLRGDDVELERDMWADDEPEYDDSYPPPCTNPGGHEFECTGTAYGGDDERWFGEGRCLCIHCGADGDA